MILKAFEFNVRGQRVPGMSEQRLAPFLQLLADLVNAFRLAWDHRAALEMPSVHDYISMKLPTLDLTLNRFKGFLLIPAMPIYFVSYK